MAIVVIGHSFISRLNDYVDRVIRQRPIRLDGMDVIFREFGGIGLPQLIQERAFIRHLFDIRVVYIEVGSNDFSHIISVTNFVNDLLRFAEDLSQSGYTEKVVIAEILYRTDRCRYRMDGQS